ncbi:MAG: c-type cytochrome [Elusimicrobia bacterium]|nr:c-type cytochrome [Elusimicrobiota bacterium]
MTRPALLAAALLAGALVLLVLATRRNLSEPHITLFAEMSRSPAYKTQSENPVLPRRMTQLPPPAGSVSRESPPRPRPGGGAKNPVAPTLAVLERGKTLYERTCSHCHGAKGRGDGAVAKAVGAFSFSLAGKSSFDLSDGELFRVVSDGRNLMPAHALQLAEQDRWSVVHYLRELQRRELARLGPLAELPEDPRRLSLVSAAYGQELYAQNCASCHGPDGRAAQPGVPTLNLPSVLAYAEDDFYFEIITHGRRGTSMPAWDKSMTRTQILSLVRFLRTWQTQEVDRSSVLARPGHPGRGEAIYRGRCAACHGRKGQGGIGNNLNNPSFLSLASPQFFRDMILSGRQHTAMPASFDLSAEQVGDLVAFLRSWAKPRHGFEEVARLLPAASKDVGAKLYDSRCAACHGGAGEGGIGSRLNSESFLRMADDRFLLRAVSEGRPGTAMPAWYFLSSREVADLLAFLRSWQKGPSVALAPGRRRGDPDFGRLVYEKGCVSCHGPEGRGGSGGQIANGVFLDSVSDEFLWRTVAHGKEGSAMRGFLEGQAAGALVPLTGSDIDHVIAYLRSLQARPRVDPLERDLPGASEAAGREVYLSKGGCAKCHGESGEGSSGPSLNSPGFLRAASNGYLVATVILGRAGTEMRSFSRSGNVHLAPKDVVDVAAYIRSWQRNPSRASRFVERSETAAREGHGLFLANCAGCHGDRGQGSAALRGLKGYAPSLNTPEFLKAADDNFLLATIAMGRPSTGMRPFGPGAGGIADLSPAEIRKIVSYIRSWEVTP